MTCTIHSYALDGTCLVCGHIDEAIRADQQAADARHAANPPPPDPPPSQPSALLAEISRLYADVKRLREERDHYREHEVPELRAKLAAAHAVPDDIDKLIDDVGHLMWHWGDRKERGQRERARGAEASLRAAVAAAVTAAEARGRSAAIAKAVAAAPCNLNETAIAEAGQALADAWDSAQEGPPHRFAVYTDPDGDPEVAAGWMAMARAHAAAVAAAHAAGRQEAMAERLVDGGLNLTLAVLRFAAGAIDSAEFGAIVAADKAQAVELARAGVASEIAAARAEALAECRLAEQLSPRHPVLSTEAAVQLVAAYDAAKLPGEYVPARAALLAALTGARQAAAIKAGAPTELRGGVICPMCHATRPFAAPLVGAASICTDCAALTGAPSSETPDAPEKPTGKRHCGDDSDLCGESPDHEIGCYCSCDRCGPWNAWIALTGAGGGR